MSEHDAVWAETTDGGLLRQLFGFYPTLHDARLRQIEIEAESRSVEFLVDYRDEPEPGGTQEPSVRMRLRWTGVEELTMTLTESFLSNLRFDHADGRIRATFEQGFGSYGTVISERFEALLEKADPPKADSESDSADQVILKFH